MKNFKVAASWSLSNTAHAQNVTMAEKQARAKAPTKKGEVLTQEKIVSQFQQMRQEQRAIANKIAELESEKNEHK